MGKKTAVLSFIVVCVSWLACLIWFLLNLESGSLKPYSRPYFSTYSAKASLTHIYQLQMMYQKEFGSFSSCFKEIGENNFHVDYYTYGIVSLGATCGEDGMQLCNEYFVGHPGPKLSCGPESAVFLASKAAAGRAPTKVEDLPATSVSKERFLAAAVGAICESGLPDLWTIDQNKILVHVRPGTCIYPYWSFGRWMQMIHYQLTTFGSLFWGVVSLSSLIFSIRIRRKGR
ncbi:MAG TPA: hypothetical protein VNJ01_05680 [Bacteriovoracaceae bacterium]|nr:hypothetical protein [Bacteriovoracaceae bacterium]